ncbi:hypothetical protein ACLM5H_12800 [Fredinandcohnia humi]
MDQFDKEIKEELQHYLGRNIQFESRDKERLRKSIDKAGKKSGKVGYYVSLVGVVALCLVLALPLFTGKWDDQNIRNQAEEHIEKQPVIDEKELPVQEEEEPIVDEEPVEQQPLSDEEIFDTVQTSFSSIITLFSEASTTYGWGYEKPFSEKEYGPFAEELRQYATSDLVHGKLLETAKEYCYIGCDAHFFPYVRSALRFTVLEKSDNQITVSFLEPATYLHYGFESTITMKKEKNTWKVSDYSSSTMELKDYNITKEEAETILSNAGVTNPKFEKEVQATHERGYITSDNSLATKPIEASIYIYFDFDSDMYIGIFSDDGLHVDDSEQLQAFLNE